MKTKFVLAENIRGGDKIIVDGVVEEVYNADYVYPEYMSTVEFQLTDGRSIVFGAMESIELVVEYVL